MPAIQELKPTVRILVVDDEPSFARYLEWMLARAGYKQVTTETDPEAAVEAFLRTQPDLLLLDLELGEVDGLSVLRRLSAHVTDAASLPIVVLTADDSTDRRRRAFSLGATDLVHKPVDRFEVVRRVGELLHARAEHARGPKRTEVPVHTVPAVRSHGRTVAV